MGDILDTVAQSVPADAPALIYGERTVSGSEFDRRSDALARRFLPAATEYARRELGVG